MPLLAAIRMASLNPARAIGLADRIGGLHQGKAANLIVTDGDLNIYLALVRGKVVHNAL